MKERRGGDENQNPANKKTTVMSKMKTRALMQVVKLYRP